ncbi:MAG: 3'-5' exonuclease, partial [Pseudomonadota bacterium]
LFAPTALEATLESKRVDIIPADARVTLMTIFKSKGLEFDHVFLPALHRDSGRKDSPAIIFEMPLDHVEGQGVLFSMNADRREKHAGQEPLYGLLADRETARAKNEIDRLLYVATTRAKQSLHLYATIQRSSTSGKIMKPRAGTFLARLWAIAESHLPKESIETPDDSANSGSPQQWRTPHVRQMTERWVPMSHPWIQGEDERHESVDDEALPVSFRWASDDARHIGTVVHHWLEQLATAASPQSVLPDVSAMQKRSATLLRLEGIGEQGLEAAASRVVDAVTTAANSEAGQWIFSNRHPECHTELALTGVIDGVVRRIVIDRVIRMDNGDVWLIDYKTSLHEGADLEAFFDNELLRYRAQMALYGRMLKRWLNKSGQSVARLRIGLYFPHYGLLREYQDALV